MTTELIITLFNILISFGFMMGIYKNKIDTANKITENYRDIDIRLVRLEEKMNFLTEKINKNDKA